MAHKVAFTALADHGGKFGVFDADRRLVFNTAITNIGGAYDKTSGIFKAQVKGVYYFRFSYQADQKDKTGLTLMKDGEIVVHSHDSSYYAGTNNGGNGAVLQLNPGEEVYVMLPAGHQVWASGNTTSFTGFMVFQN